MYFHFIKGLLTRLFFRIAPLIRWPFPSRRLLIIRLDAIGDYILFRNFLPVLTRDDRWKQYRITLLGDAVFREIAEAFDKPYVAEFIWVDSDRLKEPTYILSLVARLKMRGFDVAIDPTHSKNAMHENLLLLSGSKKIIKTTPGSGQFEFYRNHTFFSSLLDREIHVKLSLPFNESKYIDPLHKNIVLFPGAGHPSRRWAAASFASLVKQIADIDPKRFRFIIAGSGEAISTGSEIASAGLPVTDMTGKTSLIELVDLIANCQVLISNETSAVHIAAATNTRAVCISNGNHFGRFNPYPAELAGKIITVYPHERFYSTDQAEIDRLVEAYSVRSEIDINSISVKTVLEAFRKLS